MTSKGRNVYVVGVGMTKFEKPGRRENFDYPDMTLEAGQKALKDAGLSYDEVQQACVGYCYGDTTCGQKCLYQLGLTGIPVYNVNNACATGSTALMLARQLIEGGLADCVMALGFEKMQRGPLASTAYTDRVSPMTDFVHTMSQLFEITSAPITAQLFGNAGIEHMRKYGTKPEHFLKIAWKNHKHSTNNPNAQFHQEYSMDDIAKSPSVHGYLTRLQCSPTSDGAACAILASEDFVHRHNLQSQAIQIIGQSMRTDVPSTFNENSCIKVVGYDMSQQAAADVYRQTGIGPQEVDVIELHDCFSPNELITYEALALCPEGKAGELIDRGDNTYGGKYVINPSGGLISKGHPLGATGVAQCAELCWQLRGIAGKRQVTGAKVGLQHNVGLGGACVVTMYRHGFPHATLPSSAHSNIQPSLSSAALASEFQSKAIFDEIEKRLKKSGADIVKKVNGIFCFKVKSKNKEGTWIVNLKSGSGSVKFDPQGSGDVTISMDDDNLLKLMTGQLNPQKAFLTGKLKISGSMQLAMKLKELQFSTGKSKL